MTAASATSSIQVSVSSLDGHATVGTPTVSLNVVSPTEVRVSGNVRVSAITGCPADVRITVSAQDICGHPTTASQDIQVNDRIAPSITVQVSPGVLLPPNKRLELIQATVAVTEQLPQQVVDAAVGREQRAGIQRRNDLRPDIVDANIGMADTLFWLRAERLG